MYGKIFYCSCLLKFLVLPSSICTTGRYWKSLAVGLIHYVSSSICILLFITLIKYYSFTD